MLTGTVTQVLSHIYGTDIYIYMYTYVHIRIYKHAMEIGWKTNIPALRRENGSDDKTIFTIKIKKKQ